MILGITFWGVNVSPEVHLWEHYEVGTAEERWTSPNFNWVCWSIRGIPSIDFWRVLKSYMITKIYK